MTSQRQISLFTEEELTSLQVDSHVNPTHPQESDSARRMRDTSGQRCLEQYERFNRPGSWAKMFAALLIGTEGWYSTRCKLSWKLKATKSHRFYFQLAPSMPPTEGTEFGLFLTPTTREEVQDLEKFKKRMEKYPNGTTMPNLATQIMGLLPTPTASEAERGSERQLTVKDGKVQNISPKGVKYGMSIRQLAEQGFIPTPMASDATTGAIIGKNDIFVETKGLPRKINQNGTDGSVGLARLVQMLPTPNAYDWNTPRKPETFLKAKERHAQKGVNLQNPLKQMASMNMLPTPMASDCGEKVTGLETQDSLTKRARQITGQTSQLSPQFVMEMMGFPTDWTLLPFLNGDKSQLKQEETQ